MPAPFDSATIGTGSSVDFIIVNSTDNFTLDTLTFSGAVPRSVGNNGSLTFAGTGVVEVGVGNNEQQMTTQGGGRLFFKNNASVGNNSIISIGTDSGGETTFEDHSTGGSAVIDNLNSGIVNFQDNSSAGSATIESVGSSVVNFQDNSSAGSATIESVGSSVVNFQDNSSPANVRIFMFINTTVTNFTETSPSTVYSGPMSGIGTVNVGLGSGSVLTFLGPNPSIWGL